MYRVLMQHLERVQGAMFDEAVKDNAGSPVRDALGQEVVPRS